MMKNILVFILVLTCQVSLAQDTIKCISYNIRMATPNDSLDQWDNRKESLVSFLLNEKPDFIGIQEALWNQVQYLSENMPEYDFIGVGRDDGIMAGEAMIILYKKSKFTLIKEQTSWLSETPNLPSRGWDAACNRTLTAGVFEQRNGEQIAMFNTHFDHVGIIARSESIKLIDKSIKAISSDLPYVLMGDFNFEPSDPLYKELITLGLDSHDSAPNRILAYNGTYNGFQLNGDHKRRIDYIIYDKQNLKTHEYSTRNPLTKKHRYCSDHFPIISTFSQQ